MPNLMSLRHAGVALLGATVWFATGCTRSSMSRPSEPASASTQPSNDSQIATQVKSQIQGDSALNSLPIQAQVSNGVVTLSGQVNDEAARELAANDAAQVSGVRTVVNNLTVQTAAAAAAGVASAATAATATADAASAEAAKKADARKRQEAQEQARQQRREQARRARERQQAQADQVASNNPPAPVETQPQPQEPAPPLPPVQPPPPPPPPPQPVTRTITVPAGTDLSVRISEGLETGKTKTGDTFHGALADNLVINGQTAIRRGASVTGVVTDAKDAGHFRGKAELSLELQQVQTQDKTLPVVTEAWVQKGSARGKDTALKAGGGALFGTLLGALAGGGSGALIGAASGGAAGTAANAVTRGKQVQVPSESILHFKLKQPLKVTVTTMPGTQPVKSYNSGDTPQLQPPQ